MKMDQILFVQMHNEVIVDNGLSQRLQFVVERGEKVMNAKGYNRQVVIGAYRLKVEVFRVNSESLAHSYNIDFGYLFARSGEARHFVSTLCRKSITSIKELLDIVAEVSEKQKERFHKDALVQLKKDLGLFSYGPFDKELEKAKARLEVSASKEDDVR